MKRKKKSKYRILLYPIVMMLICCGCAGGQATRNQPIQSIDTAMGTIISQTIYTDGQAEETTDQILDIIIGLEQNLLSWRLESSEIYNVNLTSGTKEGAVLSDELAEILKKCMEVSEASEGAFDITIGGTVRLWDIDSWAVGKDASEYVKPSEEALQKSLEHSGYEKLVIKENSLLLPEEMQLDLGAVGKGIALDWLREYVNGQEEITGAVISVGGSILTYGQKPDGSPWKVGVVNPQEPSKNLGLLSLRGQWCVSTSGDYERYVEVDGVKFHHIIDPTTGYPADSGLSGVTILAEDGLLSDALSTACFILGREKGSTLAEHFGAEALFVDHEGNIYMTEGMEDYFQSAR